MTDDEFHITASLNVVLRDQNVSKPLHVSVTCPCAEIQNKLTIFHLKAILASFTLGCPLII